jgi:hypothetical protein
MSSRSTTKKRTGRGGKSGCRWVNGSIFVVVVEGGWRCAYISDIAAQDVRNIHSTV